MPSVTLALICVHRPIETCNIALQWPLQDMLQEWSLYSVTTFQQTLLRTRCTNHFLVQPCVTLKVTPPAPNPRKKTTGATPLCNKIPDIGAQHPRRLRERPRDVVFNTCYRCYLVLVGLYPRPSRSIIVTSLLVKVRSGTNGTAGGYRLDYVTIKGLTAAKIRGLGT